MHAESEITQAPRLGHYEIDASRSTVRRREDMTAYAQYKREVLGSLGGTVLEIGAGHGANFGYLAAGTDWIGLEPDPAARCRLATIAAAHGYHRPVIAGVAERIPLSDASVDAVASTL